MHIHLYRHCKKGHSMTVAGCSAQKCASEKELAPWRYVFMSVVGLACGLMWLVLSWRPVSSTLDRAITSILSSIAGGFSGYIVFSDARGDHGDVRKSLSSLKEQCRSLAGVCVGWLGISMVGIRKWMKQNHLSEFFKIFLVRSQHSRFSRETPCVDIIRPKKR